MKKLLTIFISLLALCPGYSQNTTVWTHRYGNYRTGWNTHEKILNTSNVNDSLFGLLFTRTVDDEVYAQPLYVPNLTINGKKHNVVFVATVNNSVYAFDADDPSASAPLWHINLTTSGATVFNKSFLPCSNYDNNIGIVGTPVIDTTTMTMYVLSHDGSALYGTSQQYMNAIDITTGQLKPGSPVPISASVSGNGEASVGGTITFDQTKHNQRTALLLNKGVVYACWASHCDRDPYHGWVMGFDANTLKAKYIYNDTPDSAEGGIWMAGNGPSVDDNGYIYIISGNGTVGLKGNPNNPIDRGESLLKFEDTGSSLKLVDFYTPSNYKYLEQNDLDYGIGADMIIPHSNFSVSNSKEGKIFLHDNSHLGKYSAGDDSLLQSIPVVSNLGPNNAYNYGTPIYHRAEGDTECVYVWAPADSLKQFFLDRSAKKFDLSKTVTGIEESASSFYGPIITGSSDDTVPGTGIVWAIRATGGFIGSGTILEAFDARNVKKQLWNSNTSSSNYMGREAKFNTPIVANGKVYVPSFSNKLYVYGLLSSIGNKTGILQKTRVNFTNLYPNPARNQITLSYSVSTGISTLSVHVIDVYGRSVLEVPLAVESGAHTQNITLNKIVPGVYSTVYYANGKFAGSSRFVKY